MRPYRAALDMKSLKESTFVQSVPPPTRCGPWAMVVGPREPFHSVFVRVIVIQIWSVSLDLLGKRAYTYSFIMCYVMYHVFVFIFFLS